MRALCLIILGAAACLLLASPSQAVGEVTIGLPSEAPVGQLFTVTLTGIAENNFTLSSSGPGGYNYGFNGRFVNGTYFFSMDLTNDGEYLFTLSSGNDSTTRTIHIICDEVCQNLKLQGMFNLADARNVQWVISFMLLFGALEVSRMMEVARMRKEMSIQLGMPIPRTGWREKLRQIRVSPSPSLGAQTVEVNPRVAFHEEKLTLLNQINEHTKKEKRPIGPNYTYDHTLMALFRAYAIADKNLYDVVVGAKAKGRKAHDGKPDTPHIATAEVEQDTASTHEELLDELTITKPEDEDNAK